MNQPKPVRQESMDSSLQYTRVVSEKLLMSPEEMKNSLPVSDIAKATVLAGRAMIEQIISGMDDRLMVIVGPCSVHDPKSALEYASRLAILREKYQTRLAIVMRVYFEKPRTTVGWKGLISSPSLDGPGDFETGLRQARELLLQINEFGLPVATEFLDPLTPPYYSDLISWGAIGARTTESQTHREMASIMSCPVGFKNGTDGSIDVAINGMTAALSPHTILAINDNGAISQLVSSGNKFTQLILRGGKRDDKDNPNYKFPYVVKSIQTLQSKGLSTQLLVDCSHANAKKDFRQQSKVLEYVLEYRKSHDEYRVSGVMIESHLEEGNQAVGPLEELEYGVSITDGCVGWEETEEMLADAYRRA